MAMISCKSKLVLVFQLTLWTFLFCPTVLFIIYISLFYSAEENILKKKNQYLNASFKNV